MQYLIYAHTETGNVRSHNEDSVFAADRIITSGSYETVSEPPFFVAVCDGVGGEKSGEIASHIAVSEISQASFGDTESFKGRISEIHEKIKAYGEENPKSKNLQTTLCCLVIDENEKAYCFNTGDSRLYFYENGRAHQISKDHTYVQMLYESGKITDYERSVHPQKYIITSSLGNPLEAPVIDVFDITEKMRGDNVIIICSDGISDYIGCIEIEAAMSLDIPFCEKIKALAELALERGSKDNVSVAAAVLNTQKEAL